MLQSDAASTITNLISWFSVFDFTKNIKQAGDEIFTCASLCQKLSLYGIILQSYCTNKKGAIFYASECILYGHVLRKDHDDWVKKCMEYEVEGPRPRGRRPKRTWREVVREDCQARKLNKEDAMDRCKWRKMIRIGVSGRMFLLVLAYPGSPG